MRTTNTTVITGAALLAVAAGAAGTLYFTGVLDGASPSGAASALCEGLVPQAPLEEFLGGQALSTDDMITARLDQEPQECSVQPRRDPLPAYYDELNVTVSRYAGSRQLLVYLERSISDDWRDVVTPLGNGWRGVLNTNGIEGHAAVVMLCGDGGQSDGSVVVNLTARHRGNTSPQITSEQRVQLARLATGTAVNAAEQAGCEAPHGKAVREVAAAFPVSVPYDSSDRSGVTAPGEATGTCAGITVDTRETEADPLAPIEDCLLLDEAGDPAFRLAAYYGPFVQGGFVATYKRGDSDKFRGPAGGSDGLYWASASCPAQGGTAFFTSETLHVPGDDRHTAADPELQQSALRTFARRSAEEHGCSTPEFSGGNPEN
ncbi:hypothetical protein [Streptomyces dysideae]|uniref:Uncharacterized protein n=1 Tax=Streptomyces dysideae TaxID=909626 RepID=A0A101UPY6_9ACTN|nr:hypothetical protein [Streptomyces dysideae]KUO14723.1 hypothetical protein AQJ91_45320 [Streptomyces dysideae]